MVLNLKILSESWWIEISKKVDKAAVFIDDPSAECLHWHGGLPRLLKAGASSVKEFSSFENGEEKEEKAVFITSNPVVGLVRMILRDIICNSKFMHCILITACSPTALTLATTGNVVEGNNEMTATLKLELDILHWMKNKDYIVEIFNFPMSFISITDYFFSCPPFQDLFPYLDTDLEGKVLGRDLHRYVEMESLPLELQVCVVHLVTTLNSLLTQLNVKEDIFCLGSLSTLIGKQLQSYSNNSIRSKTASTKMSILLIDRTMDIASVTQYTSDSLFDRVKTVLRPISGHNIDVAVNMTPVCASKVPGREENEDDMLAPGCLYHPGSSIIDILINKKQKDIFLWFYKELMSKELKSKPSMRITAETLEKSVVEIAEKSRDLVYQHSALIQEILGVVQMTNSPLISKLELAESIQKLLLQSVAAENSTFGAIKQLQQIVSTHKERGLTIDILVSIIVFFYALVGTQFPIEDGSEKDLQSAFSKALYDDRNNISASFFKELLPFPEDLTSKRADELGSLVFRKLKSLNRVRRDLINYKFVAQNKGPMAPLIYTDLISQLLTDIVDPKRPEISDLVYVPSSDSLKSRLSMILSTSKPHPLENENILLFFIGGITGKEVRMIKECFHCCNKTVFIGSTSYVTPINILNKLFVKDPLKPYLL